MAVLHSAPKFASNDGVKDALAKAIGKSLVSADEAFDEVVFTVKRDAIEDVLRMLRDVAD